VTAPEADVGQLCASVAAAVTRQTIERLAAEGFHDARAAHTAVFAGLVAGDRTVTELAARLGISPQAVSKTVAELERAGYLRKARDGTDARARRLEISERGAELVAATRRVRTAVNRDIVRWLGVRDVGELTRLLSALVELYHGPEPDR
jgi:DNA-binding MarR family transcriptional regulator